MTIGENRGGDGGNGLKLCPFCGGIAQIREYPASRVVGHPRRSGSMFGVDCGNCGVQTSKYGSDGPAIRDWNTRAPTTEDQP